MLYVTPAPASSVPATGLSAQAESLDELAIARDILLRQIVEQLSAAGDHRLQTAAPGGVVAMRLEVLGEVTDSLRQNRDLDFRGAGVSFVMFRFDYWRSLRE